MFNVTTATTSIIEPLVALAATFLQSIGFSDRVGFFYHGDPDGSCSAALLSAALEKKAVHPLTHYWVGTHEFSFSLLLDKVGQRQLDHLIFLDINLQSSSGTLEALRSLTDGRILIYDDHVLRTADIPPGITFLNPNILSPGHVPCPASLFAYLVLAGDQSAPVDITAASVAAIGLLADGGFPDWRGSLPTGIPSKDDLAHFARLISSYYLDVPTCSAPDPALELLRKVVLDKVPLSTVPQTDLNLRQLTESSRHVSSELRRNLDRYRRDPSAFSETIAGTDLVFFEVASTSRIVSLAATQIRNGLRNTVVCSFQRFGELTMIELRSPRGCAIDLAQLLSRVFAKLPAINFGGHPRAAGASIATNDLGAFLTRLREMIAAG